MRIINLTPHSIEVYNPTQFHNLLQVNPTTWVADSVEGTPIAAYPSEGVARIAVSTTAICSAELPGEIVSQSYGEATGIPDTEEAILIVSLPMLSMARQANHPRSHQMVAPYKVVRSRTNQGIVLGCMGFTY